MKTNQVVLTKFSQVSLALGLMLSGSAMASHPVDLNLAQPDKIMQMLVRSGAVSEDASQEQLEAAYTAFINNKRKNLRNIDEGELAAHAHKRTNAVLSKINAAKKNYVQSASADSLSGVTLEEWKGKTRTDRVLAILIEFPDYDHNAVTPGETSNYFDDYTRQHYQDLLFAPNGYTGSDGGTHLTMKMFYEEQSGGSYSVEGNAVGWVRAKHPAAYYGNNENGSARALVREALEQLGRDPDVDLSYYDQEDRYDLDGDGNYREPDGLIDHLMIFHSGVGEEAGGGALGEDAIWSHRWNLGNVFRIPGSKSDLPNWGGHYAAYDYTIQPVDAALGVTAHEYAHDLGLPDEYDTKYSGLGDTVSSWSLMSAGGWTGAIPGYEPVGFSTWCKEFLQQSMPELNWLSGEVRHLNDFDHNGETFVFDQANDKGTNNDYLRINLPPKRTEVNKPFAGSLAYWSGQGNNLNTSMSLDVDLTTATEAQLNFQASYQIEEDWDYAYVKVNGKTVAGNITRDTDPNNANQGHGITGNSDGWVAAEFDLSEFVGQKVTLEINYVSDPFVSELGLFVDNATVTVDGNVVATDGAEGSNLFTLNGFSATDGYREDEHYYLLEWRNHAGVDKGLQHVGRVISYEPGLLIWYRDYSVADNAVGEHPGDSWIGVIDADVQPMYWSNGNLASNRYQLRDATFSLTPLQSPMTYTSWTGNTVTDLYPLNYSQMADWNYYQNPWSPQSGRILQHYGLYITVEEQTEDRSQGKIRVRKMW